MTVLHTWAKLLVINEKITDNDHRNNLNLIEDVYVYVYSQNKHSMKMNK